MNEVRAKRVEAPEVRRGQILEAAKQCFRETGFAATKMSDIADRASLQAPSLYYHFGSKEKLVEQVFRRRLDALNAHRLAALAKIAGHPETTLEDVLAAYIRPALELSHDESGSLFMRVLARAFAEHDDTLRQFLSEHYGHVMRQFTAEFARLLPQLSKSELYWRIDLVTGALTHAMSGFGIIQRKHDVSEQVHREQTAQHLIRFSLAGLSHP